MAEKYAHLLKLGMGRYPAVDVDVQLTSLIDICKHYYNNQEAIAFITGSKVQSEETADELNAIYIANLSEDANYLAILFVRGDPDRSMPGFVNLKTRKVTTIHSDDPDAVRGASCHLVISKKAIVTGNDHGRHRAVLEQTAGISRTLVRDFVGKLLAKYAEENPEKFVATKKQKKKGLKAEEIVYRPTVRFHPQQNGSLKNDLEEGKIGGFKLIRGRTEFQGEADEPQIQKMDVQLHARIVPTGNLNGVRSLVDHIQQAMTEINFSDLKLELVDEAGEPISGTGTIDIKQFDDTDMRYCKKLLIKTIAEEDVPEVYETLFEPIIDFARKAISADKHWK
ncbi:MAG: hypothetical protein COB78_10070 [Hyphomicrobiales bacterium]|nr:MAG: hypothetical protein COB78_10070 [Hyphomicrobiales bacterium]